MSVCVQLLVCLLLYFLLLFLLHSLSLLTPDEDYVFNFLSVFFFTSCSTSCLSSSLLPSSVFIIFSLSSYTRWRLCVQLLVCLLLYFLLRFLLYSLSLLTPDEDYVSMCSTSCLSSSLLPSSVFIIFSLSSYTRWRLCQYVFNFLSVFFFTSFFCFYYILSLFLHQMKTMSVCVQLLVCLLLYFLLLFLLYSLSLLTPDEDYVSMCSTSCLSSSLLPSSVFIIFSLSSYTRWRLCVQLLVCLLLYFLLLFLLYSLSLLTPDEDYVFNFLSVFFFTSFFCFYYILSLFLHQMKTMCSTSCLSSSLLPSSVFITWRLCVQLLVCLLLYFLLRFLLYSLSLLTPVCLLLYFLLRFLLLPSSVFILSLFLHQMKTMCSTPCLSSSLLPSSVFIIFSLSSYTRWRLCVQLLVCLLLYFLLLFLLYSLSLLTPDEDYVFNSLSVFFFTSFFCFYYILSLFLHQMKTMCSTPCLSSSLLPSSVFIIFSLSSYTRWRLCVQLLVCLLLYFLLLFLLYSLSLLTPNEDYVFNSLSVFFFTSFFCFYYILSLFLHQMKTMCSTPCLSSSLLPSSVFIIFSLSSYTRWRLCVQLLVCLLLYFLLLFLLHSLSLLTPDEDYVFNFLSVFFFTSFFCFYYILSLFLHQMKTMCSTPCLSSSLLPSSVFITFSLSSYTRWRLCVQLLVCLLLYFLLRFLLYSLSLLTPDEDYVFNFLSVFFFTSFFCFYYILSLFLHQMKTMCSTSCLSSSLLPSSVFIIFSLSSYTRWRLCVQLLVCLLLYFLLLFLLYSLSLLTPDEDYVSMCSTSCLSSLLPSSVFITFSLSSYTRWRLCVQLLVCLLLYFLLLFLLHSLSLLTPDEDYVFNFLSVFFFTSFFCFYYILSLLLHQMKSMCQKHLCFYIFYGSSYRWVHFSRAVLSW